MKTSLDSIANAMIIVSSLAVVGLVAHRLVGAGQAGTQPSPISDVSGVRLQIDSLPHMGIAGAPIAIVEFSDFECPFCRRFDSDSFDRIRERLVDTGKAKFFWAQFPIEGIHKSAFGAAEAALCAQDQNQYFAMRRRLFSNPTNLTGTGFGEMAGLIGLNVADFRTCLSTGKKDEINRDRRLAAASGITSTPSILLGTFEADGQLNVTKRVRGAVSSDVVVGVAAEIARRGPS